MIVIFCALLMRFCFLASISRQMAAFVIRQFHDQFGLSLKLIKINRVDKSSDSKAGSLSLSLSLSL